MNLLKGCLFCFFQADITGLGGEKKGWCSSSSISQGVLYTRNGTVFFTVHQGSQLRPGRGHSRRLCPHQLCLANSIHHAHLCEGEQNLVGPLACNKSLLYPNNSIRCSKEPHLCPHWFRLCSPPSRVHRNKHHNGIPFATHCTSLPQRGVGV